MTAFVHDTFTGTSALGAHTSDSGADWEAAMYHSDDVGGGLVNLTVADGVVRLIDEGPVGLQDVVADAAATEANCVVEVEFQYGGESFSTELALIARYTSSSSFCQAKIRFNQDQPDASFEIVDNDEFSSYVNDYELPAALDTGTHTLKFVLDEHDLKLYLDNALVLTHEGTGTVEAGKVGFALNDYADERPPYDIVLTSFSSTLLSAIAEVRELRGWRGNTAGQMGFTATSDFVNPTLLDEGPWKMVSVGDASDNISPRYTLGIKTDGTLWAAGTNVAYVTGLGTDSGNTDEFTQVGSKLWETVSAGSLFAAAIDEDGLLFTWGSNAQGATGAGTTTGVRTTPTQVGTDTWIDVSCNRVQTGGVTLGIKSNGTLWATGQGTNRLNGLSGTNRNTFAQLGSATNWIRVHCGTSIALALNEDGELHGWGIRTNLHTTGSGVYYTEPVFLAEGPFVAVFCRQDQAFVIHEDGSLWAVGRNQSNELGLSGDPIAPIALVDSGDWVTASVAYGGGYAVKADGTMYGSGDTKWSSTESPMSSLTLLSYTNEWKQIDHGRYTTLALYGLGDALPPLDTFQEVEDTFSFSVEYMQGYSFEADGRGIRLSETTIDGTFWRDNTLDDTLALSDSVEDVSAFLVAETFSLSSGVVDSREMFVNDVLSLRDRFISTTDQTSTDVVTFSDALSDERSVTVVDSLVLSDSREAFSNTGRDVVEHLTLRDFVDVGTTDLVADTLTLSAGLAHAAQDTVSDTVTFSDSISDVGLPVGDNVVDHLLLSDAREIQGVTDHTVHETVTFSERIHHKQPGAVAWVMNTETAAPSWYSNWQFIDMVQIGDRVLAVGPEGLVELGGESDAGEDIDAGVTYGFMDFGADEKKRIDAFWMGYTSPDVLQASVETFGNPVYTYSMTPRNADSPRNNRIRPGKGLNARYWRIGIDNVGGCDFSVDSISADVVPSARRL
jgi:hypothetical protein